MNTVQDLKTEWDNVTKIPCIEVEILNTKENEIEWNAFWIESDDRGLYTFSLEDVELLVEWDDAFSLDEHLQSLSELITESILDSKIYDLAN